MRCGYEYKRKCVEMYRSGQWTETPDGIQQKRVRSRIREWVRLEDANSPEVLQLKNRNKIWTPEEKLELVMQVIFGKSNRSVVLENGINDGLLSKWVSTKL